MTTIWEIKGELEAQTPLHIGASGVGTTADAVLIRDGGNNFLIPGTSLAGVIRARLGETTADVWGDVVDDKAITSSVTIFDARMKNTVAVQERTRTAIDRVTASAAHGLLFRREYLDAGARFTFRAIIEGSAEAADLESEAKRIAALLTDGIEVGASTTSGYGRVAARGELTIRRKPLDRHNLLRTLGVAGEPEKVEYGDTHIDADVLAVTAEFTALGALFVADEHDGAVIKQFPLVSADRNMVRFQLPGTSIKGVLRSHAEMIVRTVLDVDAPGVDEIPDARDRFPAQLIGTGLPAVADLFGAPRTGDDKERTEQLGNKGALRVNAVRSTAAVPVDQWHKLLNSATDQSARAVAARINDSLKKQDGLLVIATRNSIDRFTGGAADERLFTSAEPHVGWQPLTLELDLAQLNRNVSTYNDQKKAWVSDPTRRDAALALLILVLLDLTEGWIRFGAETTRGAGAISVERQAVTFAPTPGCSVPDIQGTLADLTADNELLDRLTRAWSAQISAAEALRAQAEESHV